MDIQREMMPLQKQLSDLQGHVNDLDIMKIELELWYLHNINVPFSKWITDEYEHERLALEGVYK